MIPQHKLLGLPSTIVFMPDNLLERIVDILACFRIYPVGLIADIEKALMISVADEDEDVLRFLWSDHINSELPRIKVLRFAQVVIGVSSS